MPLSVGDKLGPFEILAAIGAGGMGEVYRARDARLNRFVAIKVSAAQFSERFEREAKAIAALNHPNICQIYDIGPNYLVMEYIEGTPLRGPLPRDQALRYAVHICDALNAAHEKNITHRDLKPGNILVTASGVKLLDFGLAKIGTASAPPAPDAATESMGLTEVGTVLGTAAYMSPEQAKGEQTDARSDIFSFGLVLYEMLSGRRAFSRNSAIETMAAILHMEPEPLQVPPALQSILARCLRKSPAERFQSMTQVKEALQAATSGVSAPATAPSRKTPSIAVLPFANMSRDADDEYFSDGLAEEIINALTHVGGLKVIARTSAFSFKGKNEDIRRIAEALGVTNILEGSVRRAGNRVRVTAQLIAAADGSHLWSERYDRELEDVFAIQDEIASAITGALQVTLVAEPAALRRYTPNLAAYEAYLKGHHYMFKFTPESVARAKAAYQQAIALDPNFALAHVGQGDYFLALADLGLMPAKEAMPLVREHARIALDIDPSLAEAQAMLGIVAGVYDYDWKEAERRFQRAMAHAPVSPQVRLWYVAFFLISIGRSLEAASEVQDILRGDPLNIVYHWNLAGALLAAGKDSEGSAELRHILELDENFWYASLMLGIFHALQGALDEALGYAQRAYATAPFAPQILGLLAGVLIRTGDAAQAEEMLQRLRPGEAYKAPAGLAIFYLVCGEIDQVTHWIGKAIEQRDPMILHISCRSFGKALVSSPLWPPLAKKMNLPELV
jgi:serine/threonine protein kinase/tetratricopeptide (TPR) repeat protein